MNNNDLNNKKFNSKKSLIERLLEERYAYFFVVVTFLSFIVWAILLFAEGKGGTQFDIFFQKCSDFMADAFNVAGYSSGRDVYHNTVYSGLGEKSYPPLTYMLMYFMSRLVDIKAYEKINSFKTMYADPSFMIILIIATIIVLLLLYELIRTVKQGENHIKALTAFAIILSAPVLYAIERGNTILFTSILVIFFLYYNDSENKVLREMALIALAMAAAFKITPAFLGIVLLYKKRWIDCVKVCLYFIVVGILPFLFFKGGFANILQMISNIQLNMSRYALLDGCTNKSFLLHYAVMIKGADGIQSLDMLLIVARIMTFIVCAVLIVAPLFWEEKWKKIMSVCVVLIILPGHSEYYCLLYMIPAIIAFLNAKERGRYDWIMMIGIFFITYSVQGILNDIFGYHLGLIIIQLWLFVSGIIAIVKHIKTRKIETELEV
ncbi:glycosyltransferase 87 family protein [Eubacterium xylanophilum]|uniref:glycosyltransferase 87 family protein n=1 Tax=Eubacterium xylanophilum TaxID=39497 RepID=UPI00047A1A8E|nr:glycosyltransferase 87 family protein [Eubacterium xylanophilum]